MPTGGIFFEQLIQDDGIKIGLAAIGAVILTLLSERYGPSLVQTSLRAIIDYIKFDIIERAIHRFDNQGLNWLGFTHKTALISGIFALAVYFIIKMAIGFLHYWYIFALILLYLVYAFSILGYRLSGPGLDLSGKFGKSCRHFFAPTINGLIIFSLDGIVSLATNLIRRWLI